jgi:hypothetical protein
MADLLSVLAKGTLITLVGISMCLELSFMSAAVRHRFALGTVFCLAVLLPVLSWGVPSWELPILARDAARGSSEPWSFVVPIYLAVTLLLLVRLCVDLVGTALIRSRAIPAGVASDLLPDLDHAQGDVQVKTSSEIRTPPDLGLDEAACPASASSHCLGRTGPVNDTAA